MSNFQKDFFNKLINQHGFYVEQYSSNDDFIAIKVVEDGIYSVIVSKQNRERENVDRARTYLLSKGTQFAIHNIVVVDGALINYEEVDYSRVFIDGHTGRVLKYDVLSEPLVKIIVSMLDGTKNSNKGVGNKVEVFKKPTTILIAINIVFFLVSVLLSGSVGDIETRVLVALGAKENYRIDHGEYYRLLTSMFLHGGIIHIAFNMYALYSIGNLVEQIYGTKKYLIIYFASGLLASFTSYKLSPYVSIGASGAIFGLLGACAVFAYKEKERIGKDFLIDMASVIFLNVIIGLTMSNIDNVAHFGGLFGGVIIAIILYKKS